MRNRPDSGSTPRRPGPRAHGGAGSNWAAVAVTISGLGNRSPSASTARSSPAAILSPTDSRTFSAHITSPPAEAGLRPGAAVDVRPTAGALPPCGLAASGARDLPYTAAPAKPSPNGGPSGADEPPADGVETVADDAILGIGMPAPRSLLGRPHADGGTEAPGQECKHRVRFMSVRRTDLMRQRSSMRRIRRTESDKPQVSGYPVRLKSGRSPVRSRPWPLRFSARPGPSGRTGFHSARRSTAATVSNRILKSSATDQFSM